MDKYEIVALVGEGGHGCVYHAVQAFTGQHVAIKVLPKGTPEMQRRTRREARILSKLRHPGLVTFLDAGVTEEEQTYIVMELLCGRTLRAALNEHAALGVAEALRLFVQIAEAVHVAHLHGVIHRDLKPLNIFITENNAAKVLDFGVAKVMDEAGNTTQRNIIPGTPLYMAPEQLEGAGTSVESDVHSIGIMLYEALSGRHPYNLNNVPMTSAQLAYNHLKAQTVLVHQVEPLIPDRVAAIVHKAMARFPPDRYSSAKALADALRAELPTLAVPGSASEDRALWRSDVSAQSPSDRFESWNALSSGGTAALHALATTDEESVPMADADTTQRDYAPLFAATLAGIGEVISVHTANSSVVQPPPEAALVQAPRAGSSTTPQPTYVAHGVATLEARSFGMAASAARADLGMEQEASRSISGTHAQVKPGERLASARPAIEVSALSSGPREVPLRHSPPLSAPASGAVPARGLFTRPQWAFIRHTAGQGLAFGTGLGVTVGIALLVFEAATARPGSPHVRNASVPLVQATPALPSAVAVNSNERRSSSRVSGLPSASATSPAVATAPGRAPAHREPARRKPTPSLAASSGAPKVDQRPAPKEPWW